MNIHDECSSRHRHSSQQSGANALPEASKTLDCIGLLEAVCHALELLLSPEAIALHLTLHNVEWVAAQPKRLTCQPTVGGDLETGDILALDIVALGILVHQVFKGQEPHAISLYFTEIGDVLTTVEAPQDASLSRELTDAVDRAIV